MTRTIPLTAADFETGLNSQVTAGDTTAELISVVDEDGNSLANGLYGMTIDGDVPDSKEYIVATLTGSNLSSVISISTQGATIASSFQKFHRRGASVAITDWVIISRLVNALTGVTGLDAGVALAYDAAPVLGSANQLATVQYVLDHVSGGSVSFNSEVIPGTAGESITVGDWVYLKESDGRWYKTDATTASKSLVTRLGKARATTTAGNAITGGVFIDGQETVGTYVLGTTYYLSNTPGALSTSAGTNAVVVGIGDAGGRLIFNGYVPKTGEKAALVGTVGAPSSVNPFLTKQAMYTTDVDQSQTTQNSTTPVGTASTTTLRNKVAQSFIPTSISIKGGKLYKIADTGSFTGTVTITLQADSAGSPSGSALATAVITNAQWLLIAAGEFPFLFAAEYAAMTIGSTYWLVVSASTADTSNCINLGTSGASTYANGLLKYNNAIDGWVTTVTDLYFKTLFGITGAVAGLDTTGRVPVAASQYALTIFDSTQSIQVVSGSGTVIAFSLTLPPGYFTTSSGIRLRYDYILFSAGVSIATAALFINGTSVFSRSLGSNNTYNGTEILTIQNNGSLAIQRYVQDSYFTNVFTPAAASGALALDTSGEVTIEVRLTSTGAGVGNAYSRYYRAIVERIA